MKGVDSGCLIDVCDNVSRVYSYSGVTTLTLCPERQWCVTLVACAPADSIVLVEESSSLHTTGDRVVG